MKPRSASSLSAATTSLRSMPVRRPRSAWLADTGGTFHQWVALNFTALNGDSIDSSELIARLAAALQINETAAKATIAEMADEQLLQIGSESVVALNDAGRERYARIRTAID